MAITRERMTKLAEAGQTFYQRTMDLHDAIERAIARHNIRPMTYAELEATLRDLHSMTRVPLNPRHSATIASELQFLLQTHHKANYMRRYMADKRGASNPNGSTAPQELRASAFPRKRETFAELSDQIKPDDSLLAHYSVEDASGMLRSRDPATRQLGQDIMTYHSAKRPEGASAYGESLRVDPTSQDLSAQDLSAIGIEPQMDEEDFCEAISGSTL